MVISVWSVSNSVGKMGQDTAQHCRQDTDVYIHSSGLSYSRQRIILLIYDFVCLGSDEKRKFVRFGKGLGGFDGLSMLAA
jgi:hypothetical protein